MREKNNVIEDRDGEKHGTSLVALPSSSSSSSSSLRSYESNTISNHDMNIRLRVASNYGDSRSSGYGSRIVSSDDSDDNKRNCSFVMTVDDDIIAFTTANNSNTGHKNENIVISRSHEIYRPMVVLEQSSSVSISNLLLHGRFLAQANGPILTLYDWHHKNSCPLAQFFVSEKNPPSITNSPTTTQLPTTHIPNSHSSATISTTGNRYDINDTQTDATTTAGPFAPLGNNDNQNLYVQDNKNNNSNDYSTYYKPSIFASLYYKTSTENEISSSFQKASQGELTLSAYPTIQDIAWKYPFNTRHSNHYNNTDPCGLWTCASKCVSFWDLRSSLNNNNNNNNSNNAWLSRNDRNQRPSIRLGCSHRMNYESNSDNNMTEYRAIACGEDDQIGVLNVHNKSLDIYSMRNPRKPIYSHKDSSHSITSIGLLYHPIQNSYISWGYDKSYYDDDHLSQDVQTTVKIWKPSFHKDSNDMTNPEQNQELDNYWDEGNNIHSDIKQSPTTTLSIPNLHCVRIPSHRSCPLFDDLFLTLSYESTTSKTSSGDDDDEVSKTNYKDTKVQLWSLSSSLVSNSTDESKIKKKTLLPISSFSIDTHSLSPYHELSKTTTNPNILMCAELATYRQLPSQQYGDNEEEDELVLCCINSKSVVTIHGLSEVKHRKGSTTVSTKNPSLNMEKGNDQTMTKVYRPILISPDISLNTSYHGTHSSDILDRHANQTQTYNMFPSTSNTNSRTASTTMKATNHNLFVSNVQQPQKDNLNTKEKSNNPSLDHPPIFHMSYNALDDSNVTQDKFNHNKEIIIETRTNNLKEDTDASNDNDDNGEVSSNKNDNIKNQREKMGVYQQAMRLPCPPLCGASFSNTDGNLIVFHNGTIQNTWSWFQTKNYSNSHDDFHNMGFVHSNNNEDHNGNEIERNISNFEREEHDFLEQELQLFQEQQLLSNSDTKDIEEEEKVFKSLNSKQSGNVNTTDLPRDSKKNGSTSTKTPRTMFDLMQMNTAAKIAQWGIDRYDDDQESRSNIIDDDEDSSSSSVSESGSEDEFILIHHHNKKQQSKLYFLAENMNTTVSSNVSATLKSDDFEPPTREDQMYHHYFGKYQEQGEEGFMGYNSNSQMNKLQSNKQNNDDKSDSDNTVNRINSTTSSSSSSSRTALIPTVSQLSPVVYLSRRYDSIVLNDQCSELAENWQLGSFSLFKNQKAQMHELDAIRTNTAIGKNVNHIESSNLNTETTMTSKIPAVRDITRGLLESSNVSSHSLDDLIHIKNGDETHFPNIPLNKSFSFGETSSGNNNILSHNGDDILHQQVITPPITQGEDEKIDNTSSLFESSATKPISRSYTTSTRHASMIGNLRKLFYYDGKESYNCVPLDQRVMQRSQLSQESVSHQHNREDQFDRNSLKKINQKEPKNYTTVHSDMEPSDLESLQLLQMTKICLHNASVAQKFGQIDKANVWRLLSQVVSNAASGTNDDFDGWGGPTGGASLGQKLIKNVLAYYEARGDVQMLATIICVFSATRDRRKVKQNYSNRDFQSTFSSPLPKCKNEDSTSKQFLLEDDQRYDSYINLYSKLLYGWGQLIIRAEIRKQLADTMPGAGGEQFIPMDVVNNEKRTLNNATTSSNLFDSSIHPQVLPLQTSKFIPNHGVANGVTFAPLCPKCHQPANAETNICNSCRDYAFRCSMCTNAVCGLFTVCLKCGHGGHTQCIMSWFKNHSTCPTGCDCTCTLSTPGTPHPQQSQQTQQLSQHLQNPNKIISTNSASIENRSFANVVLNPSTPSKRRSVIGPLFRSPNDLDQNTSRPSLTTEMGYGTMPFGAYTECSSQDNSANNLSIKFDGAALRRNLPKQIVPRSKSLV